MKRKIGTVKNEILSLNDEKWSTLRNCEKFPFESVFWLIFSFFKQKYWKMEQLQIKYFDKDDGKWSALWNFYNLTILVDLKLFLKWNDWKWKFDNETVENRIFKKINNLHLKLKFWKIMENGTLHFPPTLFLWIVPHPCLFLRFN